MAQRYARSGALASALREERTVHWSTCPCEHTQGGQACREMLCAHCWHCAAPPCSHGAQFPARCRAHEGSTARCQSATRLQTVFLSVPGGAEARATRAARFAHGARSGLRCARTVVLSVRQPPAPPGHERDCACAARAPLARAERQVGGRRAQRHTPLPPAAQPAVAVRRRVHVRVRLAHRRERARARRRRGACLARGNTREIEAVCSSGLHGGLMKHSISPSVRFARLEDAFRRRVGSGAQPCRGHQG